MNIAIFLKETANLDVTKFTDFKLEGALGFILFRGRMANGAIVVSRLYTKDDGSTEAYESHKYFDRAVRDTHIRNLSATKLRRNTIAVMMNLSEVMVNNILKETT